MPDTVAAQPSLSLGRLIQKMERDGRQSERIPALKSAPRFLFESGSDVDHSSVKRIHDAAEAMIDAGTFALPAASILIEDPAGEASQFYLCSQNAGVIEVWGATLFNVMDQSLLMLCRSPQHIDLRPERSRQTDYRVSLNSPLIAVKEFVVALAAGDTSLAVIDERAFPFIWVQCGGHPVGITAYDTSEMPGLMAMFAPVSAAAAGRRVTEYADFVDAARRGHVRKRLSDGSLVSVPAIRDLSRLAVPVYDFGHIFDPHAPDFLGVENHQMIEAAAPEEMDPPEAACAMLFRRGADEVLLTLIERLDGEFCAQTYQHSRANGFWQVVGLDTQSQESQDLGTLILRHAANASMVLAYWRENIEVMEAEHTPRAMRVSQDIQAKGSRRLPLTKVIRLLEERVRFVRPRIGSHASPVSHDRTLSKMRISDKLVTYSHPKSGKLVSYRRTQQVIELNRTIRIKGGRVEGDPNAITDGKPPVIYEVRAQ